MFVTEVGHGLPKVLLAGGMVVRTEQVVPDRIACGAEHVVSPRRAVLLEGEDGPAPVRDEGLPDPGEEPIHRDSGVFRTRVLGDAIGRECEQIHDLSALDVHHAEPRARGGANRAGFPGRHVHELAPHGTPILAAAASVHHVARGGAHAER